MAHKRHHHMKGAQGHHHHTSQQERGDAMHMHSHPGKDGDVGLHPHAHHRTPAEFSIAHGYNPPEHYDEGHEDCSSDLCKNQKHC